MNIKNNGIKKSRVVLASLVMGALLWFAAVPPVQAEDGRHKCQHRIHQAEMKLDQAIRKHGERSHQAEDRRRDLNRQRERCWNQFHFWWNEHEGRWHDQRDWDRR